MFFRIAILSLGLLLPGACTRKAALPEAARPAGPPLVVVLAVDQMRYDYLTRFREYYQAGLRRLQEEGMVFTEAHHGHALTETAPGHATISTGCYPRRNGIVANNYLDQGTGRVEYAVEDLTVKLVGAGHEGPGMSPRRLQVNGIGDWLKRQSRKSKVYSVAFKDRSSILLGGQKPDGAFWFDDASFKFIFSDYYGTDYPAWADTMVGTRRYAADLEKGWHKKLPDEAYLRLAREDNFNRESGAFFPDFPHTRERMAPFIRPDMRDARMFWLTPLGDRFTLDFARQMAVRNEMGLDPVPDILFVSCSTADAIGHHFGPYSQEVMDYYLRLDEYLGQFLDFLDQRVGKGRYLLVLSADHGVVAMPEQEAGRGVDAQRIPESLFQMAIKEATAPLRQEWGVGDTLILLSGSQGLTMDYRLTRARGIDDATARARMAAALREVNFIEDVFTVDELQTGSPIPERPFLEAYRRSYFPGRGQDLRFRFRENYLVNYPATGTTHGSPYGYDSHVPLIFFGYGLTPASIDRRVETVDIAPTLATVLQLKTTGGQFDGKVLTEVIAGLTRAVSPR